MKAAHSGKPRGIARPNTSAEKSHPCTSTHGASGEISEFDNDSAHSLNGESRAVGGLQPKCRTQGGSHHQPRKSFSAADLKWGDCLFDY